MVTAVPTVAVGDYDTATRQNYIATAIGEIQAELGIQTYRQSLATKTLVSGGAPGFGWTWPTASGYTSSGSGLTVPSAGAYVVSFMMYGVTAFGGGAWTRMLADIYYTTVSFPSNFVARNTGQIASPAVENVVCVTGVTPVLAVGGLIIPIGYQNSGSTQTFTVLTLTISPIPNLS